MHSLSMYSLSVKDVIKRSANNPAGLHSLDDIRGQSLLNLIEKFCQTYSNDYVKIDDDVNSKSVMKIKPNVIKNDFITGVIEYGHYGIPGKFVDIETKKEKKKSKNDSDIYHLYFCFYAPKGKKFGIALFHRIQITSIKSVFNQKFNNDDAFPKWTSGLKLSITPISKETNTKNWMQKTEVKKLVLERFKNKEIMGDVFDKLPEGTNITVTVNAPRNGTLGSALDWVSSNKNGKYHDSVDIVNDLCATVKSDVKMHGKVRRTTLDSQGIESRIEFDSRDVTMVDNYPSLNSLDLFAKKLAKDLAKSRN